MGTYFRLTSLLPQITEKMSLLKADFFSSLIPSSDLSVSVDKRISELKIHSKEVYEQRGEDGYEDGKNEGLRENKEHVLETVLLSVEFIEAIEDDLVHIVMNTVKKVINEMDPAERIVRIVRRALNNTKSQKDLVIRVSIADETAITKNFSNTLKSTKGGFLNIVVDARLEQGSCLIETEYGVVDASLNVQLKALESAFHSKIKY